MKRIITIAFIFFAFNVNAINVKNMPRTIVQPDGTPRWCGFAIRAHVAFPALKPVNPG